MCCASAKRQKSQRHSRGSRKSSRAQAVVLYDQAGKAHNYVVKQQIWVLPSEVEYILPKDKEMITLVSCIGDKVINNGEVVDESHRLITIAEPAG